MGIASRRTARVTLHALSFTVLWGILTGGTGWGIGVPFICLATAASILSIPANRWSLAGLGRFLPYFIGNSLRGGVDVAARALHPKLPIDPAIVRYEMQLDCMEARVIMANTVTLLPGTLAADLQGKLLLVHVLNKSGPVTETLRTLEQRIGDLFRKNRIPEAQ